jgi:hypothetical protein
MADLFEIQNIIDYIEAHPEEWDQTEWIAPTDCGTAYCVAGHAIARSDRFTFIRRRSDGASYVRDNQTGANLPIFDVAQRLLGLTWYQADRLFDSANSLDDLKHIAKGIANGEI